MEIMGLSGLALMACLVVLVLFGGLTLIIFLVKIGVIVQKAGEPKHLDQGTYTLDQGREVRGEDRD
jgi:hypothetical protein